MALGLAEAGAVIVLKGAFKTRMGLPFGKGSAFSDAPGIEIAPRLRHPVPEMGREHGMVRSPEWVVLR